MSSKKEKLKRKCTDMLVVVDYAYNSVQYMPVEEVPEDIMNFINRIGNLGSEEYGEMLQDFHFWYEHETLCSDSDSDADTDPDRADEVKVTGGARTDELIRLKNGQEFQGKVIIFIVPPK